MLPNKFRLPAKRFDEVYKKGRKIRGKYGMLVVLDTEVGSPRFGFVLSKKIGNAVLRHRMTRLLRVVMMEIVNEKNLSSLSKDFQYITFQFCDKKNDIKGDVSIQFDKVLND